MEYIEITALIIDDDTLVLRIVVAMLNLVGVKNSFIATDGNLGFDLVIKENPDIIFCDMLMPEHDGLEFLHKMKQSSIKIPVIMMTSYIDPFLEKELLNNGACLVVSKPPSRILLKSILDEKINGKIQQI